MTTSRPTFTSHGITHSLEVIPNDNNTGWLLFASSLSGTGIVSLTQGEAETLAALFVAGPGPVKYVCEEHKKIGGTCLECLL